MVTKKDVSQNHEKKKKRGKNKRHLLTSMTYHIKEKHVEEDEPEEPPEDGMGDAVSDNLEEIKETIPEDKHEHLESEADQKLEVPEEEYII